MKSKIYLDFVRSLPCCHCRTTVVDCHHLIDVGMGKMGGKASDLHTMPLCRVCHDLVHRDAKSWPQTRWMCETQDKAVEDGVILIFKEK